jgi:DNA replication protein DnaC
METIRAALNRVSVVREDDAEPRKPPECTRCGGAQWVVNKRYEPDGPEQQLLPCPECYSHMLEAKRMGVVLERSRMGQHGDVTFSATTPRPYQKQAWKDCLTFAEDPRGWFILTGEYGNGKTTLALCIANHVLKRGMQAVFQVVPDLLDHLRSTFAPASEVEYDQLFEQVRAAPLLVLDDFGSQKATEWASEKLYQILNHRHLENLSTVVTTNLGLNAFEPRLRVRLSDPARCHVCVVGGSYRGRRDER